MSDTPNPLAGKMQIVQITFKNGKVGKFYGPAVVDPTDGFLGRVGIEKVEIGRPESAMPAPIPKRPPGPKEEPS